MSALQSCGVASRQLQSMRGPCMDWERLGGDAYRRRLDLEQKLALCQNKASHMAKQLYAAAKMMS